MRRNLRLRILPEEDVVRLAVDPVPVFAWIATIYLLCMYKVVRSAARLQLSPPNYAPSLLSFHSCQNYLTVWGLSLPWFASTPLILTLELLILTHRASRRTQTNTLGSLAPKHTSKDRAHWEAVPHSESPQTVDPELLVGEGFRQRTECTSTTLALPLESCAFERLRLLEVNRYLRRWCQYFFFSTLIYNTKMTDSWQNKWRLLGRLEKKVLGTKLTSQRAPYEVWREGRKRLRRNF